jgi:hypothetical protein
MSMTPNPFPGLPADVARLIASAMLCEFGTISAQGVPIDTPLFCFAGPSSRSIDVGTGLAYPAKAERARRNPKVGILLEGGPSQPVISIGALATVKDADIQANAERYIAEVIAYFDSFSVGNPWSVARQAVWYWARIFMLATPKKILWWRSPAHLDEPPERWDAPADFEYPPSDPTPNTPPSAAAKWPTREWRERVQELLAINLTGHLTLIDGYPLPLRTRSSELVSDGLVLNVPKGAPWQRLQGKASLCFAGQATLIGDVNAGASGTHFAVERMLPDLPLVLDPREIWTPSDAIRQKLSARLEQELARRGQPLPMIPEQPPAPTPGSVTRAKLMERMQQEMATQSRKETAPI